MQAAMLREFSQNEELRAKLLAMGEKILMEASPNKRWGAGLSLNTSAMKRGECLGGNWQLMKARDDIRQAL